MAETETNTAASSVNIFARIVATASPAGLRRLRRSATTLTETGGLAAALAAHDTPEPTPVAVPSPSSRRPSPLALVSSGKPPRIVEPFGLLHHLAPLHKGALAKRALRATGLVGTATLDDLGAAFVLPAMRPADWVPRTYFNGQERVVDLLSLPPSGYDVAAVQARWDRLAPLRPAALWLSELAEAAETHPFADDSRLAAMPEDDMAELAEAHAERWRSVMASRKERRPGPMTSTEQRLCCPKHWRRVLRRRAAAARQYWCAVLQLAGGPDGQGNPSFCDDYTLERWMERQVRAEEYGKMKVWVSDHGDRVLMLDVMKASQIANLNRLYVLNVAHEELARRAGLVPVFVTITLPPQYHPNPKKGEPKPGLDLDVDPKSADRALGKLWNRLRWRLQRLDIEKLGLRVVEAHDDACPHLHALLYVRPDDVAAVDDALMAIRPEPVAGKRIATKLIRIDQSRARAVSYIMKYIVKSLNLSPEQALRERGLDAGARQDLRLSNHVELVATLDRAEAEDDPFAHGDHLENFNRVRAWASERRIRRYSLLGTHGVQGVWQRLWTQREPLGRTAPRALRQAWIAMHRETRDERLARADYERLGKDLADPDAARTAWSAWQAYRHGRMADALIWLGTVQHSAVIDRDTPRARLGYATTERLRRETVDWETGEITEETVERPLLNSYGEPVRKPVTVVYDGLDGWSLPLKRKVWTLDDATAEDIDASEVNVIALAAAKALKDAANTVMDNRPRGSAVGPLRLAIVLPDGTDIWLRWYDELCGPPTDGPPPPSGPPIFPVTTHMDAAA